MKRIYWRPQKVSERTVFVVGLVAVTAVALVELIPNSAPTSDYETKLAAAQLARDSMQAIKAERIARGDRFSRRFDPSKSGMIGEAMTPVTSLPASLEAKQTSVNPNFAAAVVDMMRSAGVRPGDTVAVGYSGSFPALNVCLCAALQTLRARPIVIASAAASQFGANDPGFLWIDMERVLFEQGLISFRTSVASLGGYGDRVAGFSEDSRAMLMAGIQRNRLELLRADRLSDSIDRRMAVYRRAAGTERIAAYVNVGGGAASVRGSVGKALFAPGLNVATPRGEEEPDCVMARFLAAGIPSIHLGDTVKLARRYDLEVAPQTAATLGLGTAFRRVRGNRIAAALGLLVILCVLRGCILKDTGHRLFSVRSRLRGRLPKRILRWLHASEAEPQLMV